MAVCLLDFCSVAVASGDSFSDLRSSRLLGAVYRIQRTDCSRGKFYLVACRVAFCVHFVLVHFVRTLVQYCVAYWELVPRFLAGMPPKKKHAEIRGEEDLVSELERETECSVSSPLSVASTASSPSPLTAEHLERVIEANQNSMAALIAALPSTLAFRPVEPSAASVAVPKLARVDVPKWTEGENPSEFFLNMSRHLHIMGCLKTSGAYCYKSICLAVPRHPLP